MAEVVRLVLQVVLAPVGCEPAMASHSSLLLLPVGMHLDVPESVS